MIGVKSVFINILKEYQTVKTTL